MQLILLLLIISSVLTGLIWLNEYSLEKSRKEKLKAKTHYPHNPRGDQFYNWFSGE